MATYWIDPFLEATTQGDGTTDTTTKNGTYAAPFSLNQFFSSSSSTVQTTVNGVTFADGDEIRMKGIAFSTLFGSEGNVYPTDDGYSGGSTLSAGERYAVFRPVTGNTTFDGTLSTSTSMLLAFANSDISTYLPGLSDPLFFSGRYWSGSNSTNILTHIGSFARAVLQEQLGYNSASTTGMELFRLKDTYANPISYNGHHYGFSIAAKVTISAGWTSETAQNGYSVFELYGTANFRYFYMQYSSTTKIKWDCGRLIVSPNLTNTAATFSGFNFYLHHSDARAEATDHVTPIFTPNLYYNFEITGCGYPGDTAEYPLISGGAWGSYLQYTTLSLYGTGSGARTTTIKNFVSGSSTIELESTNSNHNLKVGNYYGKSSRTETTSTDPKYDAYQMFNYEADPVSPITFLQNSVYYLDTADTTTEYPIVLNNATGTATYESGLKNPGIAPLNNVAQATRVGPLFAREITHQSSDLALFKTEQTINASQNWFDPVTARTPNNFQPIEYVSFGKFLLDGSDYTSISHNVGIRTAAALGSTAAPQFLIISGEHNDFDGKPLSLISDPYTAGIQYPALMYNATVSSTDVLVGQWSGNTSSGSTQAWIPLDLAVPSYTAGSDNLRAKVVVAYADGSSNSAAGSILLRAWHRDTTQSSNFRVYSSSATTVSAGGNPASPTTVTLNLSNVPTSGQDDITSVCLGIRLDFTSNTNIQKYYIVSADIETY